MTPADLERLMKLIALGQQAFIQVANIINNHKAQEGKTINQIALEAEKTTEEAIEIINNL